MAKRRNLKLVHVMDADIKTVRAVYKWVHSIVRFLFILSLLDYS
jgi:hypothetical protein